MSVATAPTADLYAAHLAGGSVLAEGAATHELPVRDWFRDRLPGDAGLLDRCHGPTLDVGCGPGRLAAALLARGVPCVGIDVSAVAVAVARARGASAVRRDVRDRVPGEGRWHHVLLADGNLGIGGDPVALLRRCRELLADGGTVLADLHDGDRVETERMRWVSGSTRSPWFPWARIGVGAIGRVAETAGVGVVATWCADGRWQAELAVGG